MVFLSQSKWTWMITIRINMGIMDKQLVGGLEPWKFMTFHILEISSSQLTNSYFSEGLKPSIRQHVWVCPKIGVYTVSNCQSVAMVFVHRQFCLWIWHACLRLQVFNFFCWVSLKATPSHRCRKKSETYRNM